MDNIFNSWIVNKYIAHRGLHTKEFAENSLSSFKNAIENNYAIELDVQQIKDGTVVVFHDDSLQRLTGQDGYLINIEKATDLKNYKLNGTKDTIPTLKEVLKLVDGKAPLMIEIKNSSKVGVLEDALIAELKNYKGEFCIISFNPYVLSYIKQHAPKMLRGQLSASFKGEKLAFLKKFLLKRLALNRVSEPHFISYEAAALPNRWVRKNKHLPLLAWTIRSQEEYLKIAKFCDNIVFENFKPKI